MNTTKMAKVLTINTHYNEKGLRMFIATTIPANAKPEQIIKKVGLEGCVESYNVSKIMPLPIALAYSNMLLSQPQK